MIEKTLITTVLYRQHLQDTNAYRTLLCGEPNVFIYDNSPSHVEELEIPSGWRYVSDTSNPGLGKAYNAAAEYARNNGFEWMLITDQDTIFPPDAIQKYNEAIRTATDEVLVIPKINVGDGKWLSPVKSRYFLPRISPTTPDGKISINDYAIINSGLMININAFFAAGGYNEKVFLDFSDFQFIERLSTLGNRKKPATGLVADIICRQDFSNISNTPEQKIARFKAFCNSLRNYRPTKSYNHIFIHLAVLRRTLSLSISLRSFKPIGTFISHYILK